MPKFFELQIKTLFQHAWSEAEHDLGYKEDKHLNLDQKRRLAFTSAQAWGGPLFEDFSGTHNARSARANLARLTFHSAIMAASSAKIAAFSRLDGERLTASAWSSRASPLSYSASAKLMHWFVAATIIVFLAEGPVMKRLVPRGLAQGQSL